MLNFQIFLFFMGIVVHGSYLGYSLFFLFFFLMLDLSNLNSNQGRAIKKGNRERE